jgi:hypothetical protein
MQAFLDKIMLISSAICSFGFITIVVFGLLMLKSKAEYPSSIGEADWHIYTVISIVIIFIAIISITFSIIFGKYTLRNKESLDCVKLINYGINHNRFDLIHDNALTLYGLCDRKNSFSELTGKLFAIIIFIEFGMIANIDFFKNEIDDISVKLSAYSQSTKIVDYANSRIKEIKNNSA